MLPSAETPVIIDDLDAFDFAETREDALQLFWCNIVVQVTDVEHLVWLIVPRPFPPWALSGVGRVGGSLQCTHSNCGRLVGGRCLRFLLFWRQVFFNWCLCCWRQVFFNWCLRCCLGKVLFGDGGSLLGGLGLGRLIAGKPALERSDWPLLALYAERRGSERVDGARLYQERLGSRGADGAGGSTTEEKPTWR